MVLLLILNVTDYGCPSGFADAERSVSALPGEFALSWPTFLHPSRRVRLDDSEAIGHGKVGRQASQQVKVIGCSANGDGDCIEFPHDPAKVGVNVGTDCIGKKRRSVRCGKNDVNEKVGVRLRHFSYAPPGLGDRWEHLYPRLAPGATIFCPLRGLMASGIGDGHAHSVQNHAKNEAVAPHIAGERRVSARERR